MLLSACAAYFAWQNWLNSDPIFSVFSQTLATSADKSKWLYVVTWENEGGTPATDFSLEAISVDPADPISKHVLFTADAANPMTKGVRKRASGDINKGDLED